MHEYTVVEYEQEDFDKIEQEMTNERAIEVLSTLPRGYFPYRLPSWDNTATESDLWHYEICEAIGRTIAIIEKIPKIKIGDSVYFLFFDNNECRIAEEKVVEVGLNGFFLSQIDDKTEPNEYVPYSKIGIEWFLKKEDAEEKMNQLKQNKKRRKKPCTK